MYISLQLPFIILLFTSVVLARRPTAYEVIQDYGFPVGLLPSSVKSYDLNRETGEFMVTLRDKCSFPFDGYDVKFKEVFSGVIKIDKLTKLKGISAGKFWVSMDIVEATRLGDEVDFSAGVFSLGFDVEDFEKSPQCGCGFDCDDLKVKDDKLLDLSM
ncbi:uncharacterized protein [Rutidosis leptorrhynchoides]|uniref:uncharacterized protein n=1 Tax=Rutidosis leptorrhynchoides TaxID=125765 RepID=UPI003A9A3B68